MASFRVIIREKENQKTKSGTYNVKIRISHKGEARDIATDYYVTPDQIDNGEIVNHPSASIYNIQLRNIQNLYETKKMDLGPRIGTMDAKTLMNYLRGIDRGGRDNDVFFMAKSIINSLKDAGRTSYANSIAQTTDHLKAFSKPPLQFDAVTPEYLERFENELRSAKKSQNTIAIHLRNLRMIYNKAIDADKIDQSSYPFRRFKIKTAPKRDRDMEIEDLCKLRDAELRLISHKRARDLFMLSFYMCGINFKDMLHAQKSDIHRDRLVVDRIKTNQPLSIKITTEARLIIDRYPGKKYMLSLLEEKLKTTNPNRKSIVYKDVTDQTNIKLKKIAEDLDIPDKISTYHARHTWSSIAFNECGVSEEIIGLALGHASPKRVTAGYIKKKYELADRANEAVIGALNGKEETPPASVQNSHQRVF